MSTDQARNKRRTLVVAALVAVATCVGLLWHGMERKDSLDTSSGFSEPTAQLTNAAYDKSAEAGLLKDGAVETGDDTPALTASDDPSVVSDQTLVTDELEYVLAARDIADEALPRLGFEYIHLSIFEYAEMRRQGQGITVPFAAARFDEGGEWRVRATSEGLVCIRITEPGWACVTIQDRVWPLFPTGPNAAVFRLSPSGDKVHTLRLLREGTCQVFIEYEDGAPYVGEFSYAPFKNERRTDFAQPFRSLHYSEGAAIPVTEGTWLRVSVMRSRRAGFRSEAIVEPSPNEVRRGRVDIVIPADESRTEPAGLILDHSEFQSGQKMLAVMVGRTGSFGGPLIELSGPGETRTDYVTPGWNRVVAFGDGIAWTSEAMVLEPGEWRRVAVTPTEAASFKLLVRDMDGKPLARSVVSLQEVGHEDWRTTDLNLPAEARYAELPSGAPESRRDLLTLSRRMSRAYSDESGEVVFRRVWTGSQTFFVEAEGYETSRVTVTLYPGQHLDYGVVRMRRAQAVVTVRAIYASDASPLDYRVSLLIPFGGRANSEHVPFNEDGLAVVERVPENRYQVMITQRGRGRGWSRWLEVRSGERHEVTIDVTREFGMQED